jgi:hypothetical protein
MTVRVPFLAFIILLTSSVPALPQELMRAEGTQPIYFVFKGNKRHIPDPPTFFRMKLDQRKVKDVPAAELNALPEHEAYPSLGEQFALIRAHGKPDVFLVGNDRKRHHVPNAETFNQLGLDWRLVADLPEAVVSAIPHGLNLSHYDTYASLCEVPHRVEETRVEAWLKTLGSGEIDLAKTPEGKRISDRLRDFAQGNEREGRLEYLRVKANGDFEGKIHLRNRQVSGSIPSVTVRPNGKLEVTHQDIVAYDVSVDGEVRGNFLKMELDGKLRVGNVEIPMEAILAFLE